MTQFNMINEPGPDPKRLLMAVMVTSAVLMVYSYFFAPTPEPQIVVTKKESVEEKNDVHQKNIPLAATKDSLHHAMATPLSLATSDVGFLVDERDKKSSRISYRGKISGRGGVVSEFVLTGFSKEQLLFDRKNRGSFLVGIKSKNNLVTLNEDSPYEVVSEDAYKTTLRHVTKEGLRVEREYKFLKNATLSEEVRFKNLSATPLKLELMFHSIKVDEKGSGAGLLNPGVQGDSIVVKSREKHERFNAGDLVDKPKIIENPLYAGFDHQFFLSAILPKDGSNLISAEARSFDLDDDLRKSEIDIHIRPFVLVMGEEKVFDHQLFMGPKQVDLLSSISPPLDENIDFGWFGALSRPMLWLLVQIFNFVNNYGLAIILITFIIKLLTYPLTHKSFSSQQEMKKLAPKIEELKKKYSHDRTLLGQKQMELYKEHGVNPVAGCLPMLIQLPIWFAFFQMLRNSVELFDQPFYGWIHDLTLPDPYIVLPILMGVSMFIQQAFTPTPSDQPQMKYVMMGMPVFLTFIMLNMPSGLSLYILTNNLLTILQQMIIKKQSAKISS